MTQATKLSCLLCAITVIIAVSFLSNTIQNYRIQFQLYAIELYTELRHLSGATPKQINYLEESSELHALTVYTDAVPAIIEIEKIKTPYHAEMLLPEGPYEITVSYFDGGTTQIWIRLNEDNQVFYAKSPR